MHKLIQLFCLIVSLASTAAFRSQRSAYHTLRPSRAHSSLDTETVLIKTSVVDAAFESYADRKYDDVISLFLDELESSPYTYSQLYGKYRKFFNLGFTSLLRRRQRAKVSDLIDIIVTEVEEKPTGRMDFDDGGVRDEVSAEERRQILSHDTIHILLKDALQRKQVDEAESIYKQYFNVMKPKKTSPRNTKARSEGELLDPILRTLNLMIDGCRDLKQTIKASFYIEQMSLFRMRPDPYTFTSLVRMAKTPQVIIDILVNYFDNDKNYSNDNDIVYELKDKDASVESVVSYPLVRCCIESLGKLGHPSDALEAACFFLSGNANINENGHESSSNTLMVSNDLLRDKELRVDQSMYVNELSGDAFLASLLSVASNKRRIFSQSKKKLMDKWKYAFNEAGYQRYVDIMQYSNGCTSGYIALLLSGAVAEVDTVSGQSIERTQFGNKGYSLLLSYLNFVENEIAQGSLNGKMSENSRIVSKSNTDPKDSKSYLRPFYMFIDDGEQYVTKSRLQKIRNTARKRLRVSLIQELKYCVMEKAKRGMNEQTLTDSNASGIQSTAIADVEKSAATALPSAALQLNGRLCDALLRSFSDDAALCRYIWRNDVYPLARLYCRDKDSKSEKAMNEIIEKSFEALIYSSGRCYMPEIGLEIVNTVRKRNWDDSFIKCLSKNYLLGCQKQKKGLLSGFESDYSLRIELGIFAESKDEDTSIRLILKEGTTGDG